MNETPNLLQNYEDLSQYRDYFTISLLFHYSARSNGYHKCISCVVSYLCNLVRQRESEVKISPHTHIESPLSASTLSSFIKQSKELKREYFVSTDHGRLSSIMKAYSQAKKAGLKFIPGLEIYFKDTTCPFITGTTADRCKYFTTTIYCQDQDAYQELCKIVSRTDLPSMNFYEEEQQLWGWKELEEISKLNTKIVLAGVHDLVGKPMLAGRADVGEKILLRLKELFQDRLSVAIVAEPFSKKWHNVVEIQYEDGSKDALLSSDLVSTDRARSIKAKDLTNDTYSRHKHIKTKSVNMMTSEVNKDIKKVTLHKGFLPLPGGDAQFKVNRFFSALAAKHQIKILVTDYAYYANKTDKIVQTMRLEGHNKLQSNFHMKSEEEITTYLMQNMGFTAEKSKNIINNNDDWAKSFDKFSLKYEIRLVDHEGDALDKTMSIIRQNGRMKWDSSLWVDRLREELNVIAKNPVKNLLPYFFPIVEVNEFYRQQNALVGVARGSAGGSLLCYLMGVTNLDPMKYDLSFNRFLSLDRIKNGDWPDVDSDFGNRELLIGKDGKSGYLYEKYGDRAAQVSTRSMIRLKSALKDVNRFFHGSVQKEIETLTAGLPAPPQGVDDYKFVFGYEDDEGKHVDGLVEQSAELSKYIEDRPAEWDIVSKSLGLIRAQSLHACAFLISNTPLSNVIPIKDGHITQYESKECENAGLQKYDFLSVSQIEDIEVCLKLINKKNKEDLEIGYFTHNGNKTYIWDLPEDLEVFKSYWSGNTATIFQLHTASMIPFVKDIKPKSIEDISTILALVRPGPLDFIDPNTGRNMAEEYVCRRNGQSESDFPELDSIIPETYSVIIFQEQQLKIAKEIAGMSPDAAENLRRLFAKKKKVEALEMKPIFMKTAVTKIGQEKADRLWGMMETFARYSFNKSHSTAYAVIAYACMFLKHFYPLEWWAAVLTNATEQEITGKFWPFVKDIVSPPDINLSSDVMAVDYANNLIRSKIGIIRGMGDKTIEPIVNGRPYTDVQDYVNKDVAGEALSHKLIHVGVLDSLFPPKTTLIEKLTLYQQARENRAFAEKVRVAKEEKRKIRALEPKKAVVPEEYINLHPVKDAAMRKSVLPSMPIDLFDLGSKYSKVLNSYSDKPAVTSSRGHRTLLVNGEKLRRLDELEGSSVDEDIYVACTCYVLEAKEFSYAKNTKRALKMTLDAGGYISEKVLWPEYESGKLIYESTLKKGCIATIFFRKKVGRKDMSIMRAVVET